MAEIKQSYERQLTATRSKMQEEMDESAKAKSKLVREYELRLEEERIRLNKIHEENVSRMRDMHQW